MNSVLVTVVIPDWLVEHLGHPDQAALERRVLEALVADCIRTGDVSLARAGTWLGLNAPGAMDASIEVHRIATSDTGAASGA